MGNHILSKSQRKITSVNHMWHARGCFSGKEARSFTGFPRDEMLLWNATASNGHFSRKNPLINSALLKPFTTPFSAEKIWPCPRCQRGGTRYCSIGSTRFGRHGSPERHRHGHTGPAHFQCWSDPLMGRKGRHDPQGLTLVGPHTHALRRQRVMRPVHGISRWL